ncbi:uncharacterized protein MYCFIDRAFT_29644 [Pseudocercospora fijiensis CIRAD86]|uniref:TauD/TfdA-like domain-containing protein n=1 Tax=Pseudocercospora fijiensis (strain CIRAD86) TaxID=383855 RepID=M3BCP1_PSEFD|nr:uncharacterized protein MYCFIDRAFT_29644 [Pseudocercospora fijiensis CIRAD86]EME87047.1 hypothetical protein MYCFIDRAFT_29644 [Pseudocercospora fijiensis CIRAD86]
MFKRTSRIVRLPRPSVSLNPPHRAVATYATPNPPTSTSTRSEICNNIQVERIAGGCGAFIHDIDLRVLTKDTAKTIRQALLDNQVIFFRNQPLSPPEFLHFTSFFGKPVEYPFVKGLDGHPEVIQVLKKETETGANFGGVWHSDTTYLPEPPMASILLAKEVPSVGGDTLWSNQYQAYESLSSGLKRTLDPLLCVQSSAKADASKTREDRIADSGRETEHMEKLHPVVRTHPETGRRALFVNVAHTTRFEGWTEDESAALLQFLFKHQVKPEFTCRLRWEAGTIAFWDNRCTQHYPLNDYHGYRRRMHRITLAGDKPV